MTSQSPSSLSLPTRRAVLGIAPAGALGIGLGGCYPFQYRIYQNFRITVEDEFGRELGSGVWRYGENDTQPALSEWYGTDGEAFPIVHPTYGKMYVARGDNSGWGGGWYWARTFCGFTSAKDYCPKRKARDFMALMASSVSRR